MISSALGRENTDRVGKEPAACGGGGVVVELADFSGLDSGELVKLVFEADSARRRLDGYLAALLGRLGDLEGQEAVEELCRQFGLGRHRARQQAKAAGALKALPTTLEAVKGGWISMDHARVMGESHERAPLTRAQELELITVAISEDLDLFKKTVARSEDQRWADDGLNRHEHQQQRRSAKVFDGDDEMVILHAELDRIAGGRVKTALDGLSDRLFRDDARAGSDRTHAQRNADALVPSSPNGLRALAPPRVTVATMAARIAAPQATTLIVSVDYDTLSGQLKNAGLIDGTPIDIDGLRHIACDANIVPAIFAADSQPLYLDREQRAAAARKLALAVRDKKCVGCGIRASACDAHHIIWWDDDGPTNITNLVLLCPKCHKKVHKHGHQMTKTPNRQHGLKPPKLKPPQPVRTSPPPRGPTRPPAAAPVHHPPTPPSTNPLSLLGRPGRTQ